MRALVLTAVLLVAGVPFASGNAPPVAVANVQATALVGEPIAFVSASYDPDGAIVSTTWEFSDDGRTYSGASVTKVLLFPGLHTIVLRVRDDLGATASKDVQVLVQAPLMKGRATAVRAGDTTLADTGDVSTSQQITQTAAEGELRNGGIRFARLSSEVHTVSDSQGPRAVARADVGYVHIPLPIGYVLVTGIEAEAIVGCSFPTLVNAKFGQIRLNDGNQLGVAGDVPANTQVPLPGVGALVLNAQEMTADGRLAVTALRLETPAGVTEVARAEAGVEHCPYHG